MRFVLLGGSGILGTGFLDALARERRAREVVRLRPDWSHPDLAGRQVRDQVAAALDHEGPTTVLWAAGVGSVGAGREEMESERAGLAATCAVLADLPAARRHRTRLVFASSAGAVHAANDGRPIREDSPTVPLSEYGRAKLAQEQLCRDVGSSAEVGVLICRYSNLYGLASGRLPAKGLIPAAIRAARLRQPMSIYVSPDTRRDYVYGPDAAAATLALARDLPAGTTVALVAQGATSTVAEIVHTVGGILGRRVPATFAVRPETALQPRTLPFAPRHPVPTLVARTPMSVAIHRMAHAPA